MPLFRNLGACHGIKNSARNLQAYFFFIAARV